MRRYLALIEHDAVAQAFGVAVPDCPGCTAMGESFDEAEAQAIEALQRWVRDLTADGHDLPRARDVAELRADPSLADDFGPGTIVLSLPVALDADRAVHVDVSMEATLLAQVDAAARPDPACLPGERGAGQDRGRPRRPRRRDLTFRLPPGAPR